MFRSKKNEQENEGLGRSCGGFSTKIHAVCDALGNPLDFIITGGEVADCTQFEDLTKHLEFKAALADKGYDSNYIIEFIEKQGAEVIIPPQKNLLSKDFTIKKFTKKGTKSRIYLGF